MKVRFIAFNTPEQLHADLPGGIEWPPHWAGPVTGVAAVFHEIAADDAGLAAIDASFRFCMESAVVLVAPDFAGAETKANNPAAQGMADAWRAYSGRLDPVLHCPCGDLRLRGWPKVMGILNVTPDSFSDGGRFLGLDAALAQAECMVVAGADMLDIGGESSRPGADPVSLNEELHRVIPVIEAIRKRFKLPISIDTYKSGVARKAIEAGADIVNDISGFSADAQMAETVAELKVPAILMHMKGEPKTMQANPVYRDLVGDIIDSLAQSIARAESAGMQRSQIVIDPGIGFGKSRPDNFVLLRRLREFLALGCPMLLGASRKSFIGWALDRPESDRLAGSLAAATVAVMHGAHILRVHDVQATRDAVEIAWRIQTAN